MRLYFVARERTYSDVMTNGISNGQLLCDSAEILCNAALGMSSSGSVGIVEIELSGVPGHYQNFGPGYYAYGDQECEFISVTWVKKEKCV